MISLEVKTRLDIEEVGTRLKAAFGKEMGLDLVEESSECLNFQGGGGFVNAVICHEEGKTKVELSAREYEKEVEKFAKDLPQ